MKVIFHIDMDCFFASCHEAINPSLHTLPIVVCYESRRAIALTANYEARKYNITAGTPAFRFKKLCSDVVIIKPDGKLYTETAEKIFELLFKIIKKRNLIEIASIDECYIDVTEIYKVYGTALNYAKMIQETIYQTLHIPCSVGISFNKAFAKIASNNAKPYGVKIITDKNYQSIIYPMKIKEFSGIGKKTETKLVQMGINTLGELANYANALSLKQIFGKGIIGIINELHGQGSDIISQNEVKSIGNEFTLDKDINNFSEIKEYLWILSEHLTRRIKKNYLLCNTVTIVLKYSDFTRRNYQQKINTYINDQQTFYQIAVKLLDKNWNEKSVRLVGLRLSGFKNYSSVAHQQTIDDTNISYNKDNEQNNIFSHRYSFINELNNKYQKQVLIWGKNLVHNNNRPNHNFTKDDKEKIIDRGVKKF